MLRIDCGVEERSPPGCANKCSCKELSDACDWKDEPMEIGEAESPSDISVDMDAGEDKGGGGGGELGGDT